MLVNSPLCSASIFPLDHGLSLINKVDQTQLFPFVFTVEFFRQETHMLECISAANANDTVGSTDINMPWIIIVRIVTWLNEEWK